MKRLISLFVVGIFVFTTPAFGGTEFEQVEDTSRPSGLKATDWVRYRLKGHGHTWKKMRKQGATLFMTLLAAFGTLLHRLGHQDEILVGSPIAGRSHEQTEVLIGMFINTLVFKLDFSGNPTFLELLRRVRDSTELLPGRADPPAPGAGRCPGGRRIVGRYARRRAPVP